MTDLSRRHNKLLFAVRRSIRYHARRRMFFERWHLVTSAVAVVFGAGTMMAVLADLGKAVTASAALVVTVFSAIDLVVGYVRRARLHEDLGSRFIALEKRLISEQLSANMLSAAETGRLDIESAEPPVKRVLDSICHNDMLRAMGYDRGRFLRIKPYQRWLAQFLDVGLDAIRPESEFSSNPKKAPA